MRCPLHLCFFLLYFQYLTPLWNSVSKDSFGLVVFKTSNGLCCLSPFQTLPRDLVLGPCCTGQHSSPFQWMGSSRFPVSIHELFGGLSCSQVCQTSPVSCGFLLSRPCYHTALVTGCLSSPICIFKSVERPCHFVDWQMLSVSFLALSSSFCFHMGVWRDEKLCHRPCRFTLAF